jgi:glycosyltransferase involved in cell wall biosynthesis
MLATGTVADAVAHGLPALVSGWPFLTEYLGDAAIALGETPDDAAAIIDALDDATLARARAASIALQERYAPERIATETFDLLRRVGSGVL